MTYLRSLLHQEGLFSNEFANGKAHKSQHFGFFLKPMFLLAEVILLNLCLLVAIFLKRGDFVMNNGLLLFITSCNLLWLGLTLFLKRYHEPDNKLSIWEALVSVIKTVSIHLLIISASIQFFNIFRAKPYLIHLSALMIVVMPAGRFIMFLVLAQYRKLGYNFKNVAIIGSGELANQLYGFIKSNPGLGMNFRGFLVDDNPSHTLPTDMIKGGLSDLEAFCQKHNINEIYCTLPISDTENIAKIMDFADNNIIRFRLIPDFGGLLNKRVKINFYEDIPVVTPRHEPLEQVSNRIIKRVFDIVFSLLIISLIFPILFPILALLIKLSSKGPVFFKQLRTGKDNKSFYCYKFRTMRINHDSDKKQATKGDNRITKIGAFMRKTSIDELPQFFNVLQGDMSVIGPRPHMLLHTEEYSKIINKFMVRHFVKPGISGWAQVNGFRGNTETPDLMEKRVEYDMWYLENWSIWLDIKIVFMTMINAIKGEENAF